MAVQTTNNRPLNPRGNDQSPKGFNRAKIFSGKALDFDGVNDLVTATGSNTLSFSQITMSAYFKFDNLGATQVIFAKRKNVAGYWTAAFVMSSSGELDFRTTTGTTEQKVVYSDFVTGEYYHAVGVKDDSNNYLYINGQLVDTTASGAIDNTTDYNFVLGNNATGIYHYNGQIANAKVFSTALTATQVADLYNNPEKIVPTGVADSALKLWLPMQEGAGTTAYDGSGNGNHGAVSGATYTHGIGAPVSQTAVIDWNKGTNLVQYSEQFDNAAWVKSNSSVNANTAVSPSGNTDADLITSSGSEGQIYQTKTLNGSHTFSTFFKAGTSVLARLQFYDSGAGTSGVGIYNLTTLSVSATGLSSTGTITDYGNGWYRCTLTASLSGSAVLCFLGLNENAKNILAWGASLEQAASVGPYVPTLSTAQTSDVLLPAGLTTGRDITGVNLFENVRKQGALNLDGNSWAEVHDNASLDITTAVSVEAWVYWDTDGIINRGILGKWTSSTGYLLYKSLASRVNFFINGSSSVYISVANGWNHIVGTFDGANRKIYINGALEETDADTSTITAISLPLEIGAYGGFGPNAYDQAVAQPRIYNRALTAAEIQQNYNAGKNIYTN